MTTKYENIISVKIYRYYYWLEINFVHFLLYLLFGGAKVEGKENVDYDPTKTYVVLANHCSYIDPLFVGHAVPRPIAYMAKAEIFKVPLLRTWVHFNAAFPVRRKSGDQSYIKNSLYALNHGWLLTMFPEGGRSFDGKFMRAKSGAARILIEAKVPFLPVALVNTHNAWGKKKRLKLFKKVNIKIGKMVYPSEYMPDENLTYEEKMEYIRKIYEQKINELLPDSQKQLTNSNMDTPLKK